MIFFGKTFAEKQREAKGARYDADVRAAKSEVIPFPARPSPNPGNGAREAVATYLSQVHPARGHGATDCGEMLFGLSDGDHMLMWLAAEGFVLVPLPDEGMK